jgi:hypothetical protein
VYTIVPPQELEGNYVGKTYLGFIFIAKRDLGLLSYRTKSGFLEKRGWNFILEKNTNAIFFVNTSDTSLSSIASLICLLVLHL